MSSDFQGKTVLITGGSGSIGLALSFYFQAAGACVWILDIQAPVDPDGRLNFMACDVSNPDSVNHAIQQLSHKLASIDILVVSAGIHVLASLEATSPDILQQVMGVNTLGAYYVLQAVLPKMMAQAYGRVVLMSSEQALVGRPLGSAYGMSKAALIHLAKSCSAEYSAHNVLINCVCPASVSHTRMTEVALAYFSDQSGESIATWLERFQAEQVTGAMVDLSELLETVHFLCSPRIRSITGQAVVLDGGLTEVRL